MAGAHARGSAHEVGHTLGVDHKERGLMTESSSDPKRSYSIGIDEVSTIISNVFQKSNPDVGEGTLYESGKSSISSKELKNGEVNEKTK